MYRDSLYAASDEQGIFGPATDLAFGLFGFMLLLFLIANNERGLQLEQIIERQETLVIELASGFSATVATDGAERIISGRIDDNDVVVRVWTNGAAQQTFSLGESLLFQTGKHALSESSGGIEALSLFVEKLIPNLHFLDEIQIEGHADTAPYKPNCQCKDTWRLPNLELAAQRSISVYELFVNQGLDPTATLISISSFGEFKPASRISGEAYNRVRLATANETGSLKTRNRRVEITLKYSTK